MAYSELVKNFEKVRSYMREFYVFGFKSRSEYDNKSARSYDDERRRIEGWLGDYMSFTQTADGKNVFISVDSRATKSNPLYRAWKTKSFTDGDITLHFIIFDILSSPEIKLTLSEIVGEIDEYLSVFEEPMSFDESTVRKKLKEYSEEGIICMEKVGRRVTYSRARDMDIAPFSDAINFFSEVAPCGVVGSFMQDREAGSCNHEGANIFTFKHHYITQALDSDIMARLFTAIREGRFVTVDNLAKRATEKKAVRLLPLKIFMSSQNGRQHLIANHVLSGRLGVYRLDYLSNVRLEEVCDEAGDLKERFKEVEEHMWGVNCRWSFDEIEHVEFDVRVAEHEEHIIRRLEREKRCGRIEKIDEHTYRFIADVFDTTEMIPWIRTFISRITKMNFSNRTVENTFKGDLKKMYEMYGIDPESSMDGGGSDDI